MTTRKLNTKDWILLPLTKRSGSLTAKAFCFSDPARASWGGLVEHG
jgi:hypothetical protein